MVPDVDGEGVLHSHFIPTMKEVTKQKRKKEIWALASALLLFSLRALSRLYFILKLFIFPRV
jgi:hypothetical protein